MALRCLSKDGEAPLGIEVSDAERGTSHVLRGLSSRRILGGKVGGTATGIDLEGRRAAQRLVGPMDGVVD